MTRSTVRLAVGAIFCCVVVQPQTARAQQPATAEPDPAAVLATIAAVRYLLVEVDSLETVSWPSGKALLARRPGSVALSGISTGRSEDPAMAIALTERIVTLLNSQRLSAHSVARSDAQYCGRGNSVHCSLPDDVGLLLLIGYPSVLGTSHIARITMVTDSRIQSGRPVVSLDIVVQEVNGTWNVVSVERIRMLSD